MALKPVFAQGNVAAGGLSRINVEGVLITVEGGSILEVSEHKLQIRALSLSPSIILGNTPIVFEQTPITSEETSTALPITPGLPTDENMGRSVLAQTPLVSTSHTFEFTVTNINPQRIVLEGDAQLQRESQKVSLKVNHATGEYKILKLKAAPPDTDSFSFAVMGDSRGGVNTFKSILKKLNKTKPLFAVNCGDLVNNGRRGEYRQFKKLIRSFNYPLFFAIGNHDILSWGRMVYQEYFGPTYYSFDFQQAHFILLDNALGRIDDHQFRWLERDLKQNDKTYTFMFMHIPPFDPRPDKYHAMSSQPNAKYLMDLAAKYKVDRVFCSHIHEYHRQERDGIIYLITGGAGAKLRSPEAYYHYLLITVGKEGITEEVIKLH